MCTRSLVQRDPQAVSTTSAASSVANVYLRGAVLIHTLNDAKTTDTGTRDCVTETLFALLFKDVLHIGKENFQPRRSAQGSANALQVGTQLKRLAGKEL